MPDRGPVLVALDYDNAAKALELAGQLDPERCRLKVGNELFTTAGPALVESLHSQGFEVFLDLKFHDIPNTVASAVAAAARLGVWMVNVHTSGGLRMLQAAREAVDQQRHKPLLIGVTLLTSMSEEDLQGIGVQQGPASQVQMLADLACRGGMDGVVCSAQEASALKREFGPDFCLVTPGIRPQNTSNDDQRRVMTPAQALNAGSDYLVVGRPITRSSDPRAAVEAILAEIG